MVERLTAYFEARRAAAEEQLALGNDVRTAEKANSDWYQVTCEAVEAAIKPEDVLALPGGGPLVAADVRAARLQADEWFVRFLARLKAESESPYCAASTGIYRPPKPPAVEA